MNAEEQLREENIEKLRNQSTYLFKKGTLGFEKAKYKALDFLPIYEIMGEEDEKEEYLEIRRQHIKDLQADIDSFYLTHQDEIGLPEEIIGGVIEGITDVSNLAVNVGVAVATGGTSIPAQFAVGLGADFATLYYDTNEFEDRNPTALELGLTAGMSIVGTGINYGATKWNASKQSIKDYGVKSTSTSNPTFEKINPSKIMEEQGDTLAFNGATKQSYYSQYKNTDTDPYLNIKLSTDEIKQNPTMLGRMYEEYKFNNPSEASPYYFKRHTYNNNTTYNNMLNNLEPTMNNWVENTYYKAVKKEATPTTNGIDIDIDRQILFIDNELSVNKLKALNEYNNLMESKSIDVLNYFNKRENKTDLVEAYIKSDYTNMDIPEAYKKGIGAMSDDEWLLTSMRNDFDIYNANNETMYRIVKDYKHLIDSETGHSKLSPEFLEEVIMGVSKDGKSISSQDAKILIKSLTDDDYMRLSNALTDYQKAIAETTDDEIIEEIRQEFIERIGGDVSEDYSSIFEFFDKPEMRNLNIKEVYNIQNFDEAFNKTDLTKKHRIANRHIPGDEATVRKNIRIQRAINKQKMMMDYYDYYKGNFDNQIAQDIDIKDLVVEGKLDELADKVRPMIEKYFSISTEETLSNEQIAKIWHEFLVNLNMTKNSWKYTDRGISLSDMAYMFNSKDSFYDFFINEMSKQDYLKHNTELLQSFYSRQVDDISRFMTFGTTSPYKISNEVDFKSQSILSKQLDKGLNDGEKAFVSNVKTRMDNYITNTMMPWNKGNVNRTIQVSRAARKAITSSTLGLTGATELGPSNWVLSFYKASKYDNSLWKQDLISLAKAMKAMGADATDAKYRMGELGIELEKLAKFDNDWTDKAVDIALILQQASDNQFKKFAHIRTTTILDNMNADITKLQPELVSVLKRYGINENNYLDFRNYVKKHISANNNTINFDALLNSSLKEDERFLLVANELIEDIGSHTRNMKVSDTSYKSDEIINWLYSYRTFKRFLNKDLFRRVSYYQDVNGVSKARFTSEGVKHTLKEFPLMNLIYFAGPLAAVSGAWQSTLKEQEKSLGNTALMYANFKNSVDENIQQYSTEGYIDEDETAVGYLFKLGVMYPGKNIALNLGKTFGYDFSDGFLKGIKSEFETSSPIYKPIKLAIESYTTLRDPEKQLYGTNVGEAGVKLVEFGSSFIPAGRLSYTWINNYLSTAEEIASNVKGSNEKKTNLRLYMKEYYDITDDEYDKLESASIKINNNKLDTLSNKEKEIVDKTLNKELLNTIQQQADNMQVVADYIGDRSASFEKLNIGQKNIYNQIAKIKGWSETEKESHKAEFAMYALGNRESIWYAIQEHYGISKEELGY